MTKTKLTLAIALALSAPFASAANTSSALPELPTNFDFTVGAVDGTIHSQIGSQQTTDLADGLAAGKTGIVYGGSPSGANSNIFLGALSNQKEVTNNGTIWVVSNPSAKYAVGMQNTYNVAATMINNGTIYVQGTSQDQSKAMGADSGSSIINQGQIFVDNGSGMYFSSDNNPATAKKMENNGTITVYKGAGMNFSKSGNGQNVTIANNKVINVVGNSTSTYGMYLVLATNTSMTNAGTISVEGKGTGIKVGGQDNTLTNSGTINANGNVAIDASSAKQFKLNLEGNSSIVGDIKLHETAELTATDLAKNEILSLTNDKLDKLTLDNSAITIGGEGTLTTNESHFDNGSAIHVTGNRAINAGAVTGDAVYYFDHTASEGALLTAKKANDETTMTVNFDKTITDQLDGAQDASELVGDQIDFDGEMTARFEEGDLNGETIVQTDDKGNVVSSKSEVNTKLDAMVSSTTMAALAWRHEMNDVNKRMGELRDQPGEIGSWVRIYGSKMSYGDQNVTAKNTSIQIGADKAIGDWKVGAAFSYTDGTATADNGSGDNKTYAIAAYGSWFANNGLFVDLIAKYARLNQDFQFGNMAGGTDNDAFSVSAETGWHFALNDIAFIEPQAEITYGRIKGDNFHTSNGLSISQDDMDSLVGRLGVRTGFNFAENRGNLYARASVLYDFQGELETVASNGMKSRTFKEDLGGAWCEFGIGGNFRLTPASNIYVDLERTNGGEVVEDWRYNVGFRHVF